MSPWWKRFLPSSCADLWKDVWAYHATFASGVGGKSTGVRAKRDTAASQYVSMKGHIFNELHQ